MTRRNANTIHMPVERRYVSRLFIAVFASVGVAALCPRIVGDISASIPILIEWVFIPTGSMIPVSTVIYTCLGDLLFCYLFSDFMEDGVSYSAIHVLSRSAGRFEWFAKRLWSMAIYLLLYVACCDVLKAIIGGAPISLDSAVFVMSVALLDFLMMTTLMAAVFLCGTALNPIASYLAIACTHLASLCFFASLTPEVASSIAYVLPSAQGIYAIHGHVGPTFSVDLQIDMIGLGYSYIYLTLLSLTLIFALWVNFSKRDFL